MYKYFHESRLLLVVLVFLFLVLSNIKSQAQTEAISEVDFNKDSRSVLLSLNSNGISAGFRFSKRLDGFRSRLVDIDLVWIKSPKEKKINGYNSKYVYGKLNQLVVGRVGYGRQKEIYGKYADGGIAISYYYNVGLTVGWLKPVYLEIRKLDEGNRTYTEDVRFYDNISNVNGRSPFYKGLEESEFAFGGFAKFAFSFDINKKYKAINALELGAVFDFFHRDLTIMATKKQNQYLLTFFIAYRFGQKKDQRINNQ